MTDIAILEEAERDENGVLVYEHTIQKPNGETKTHKTNVSALLTPGERTTTSIQNLLIEARMVDDGKEVENPWIPGNEEIAEQAIERIEREGLEPAWTQ